MGNFALELLSSPLPIGIALIVAKVSAMDAACGTPSSFCSLILVWWNSKELVMEEIYSGSACASPIVICPLGRIKVLLPITFPSGPYPLV